MSYFVLTYIEIKWRRQWHPTPVLLPGKSHGRRSLVGCSPWGCKESDTTERLRFHFSLSCVGEGNGNPLQCSCLENPREGEPGGLPSMGSQSRTRLKRLSSSRGFIGKRRSLMRESKADLVWFLVETPVAPSLGPDTGGCCVNWTRWGGRGGHPSPTGL